jgi:hypothetical protein
MPSKPATDRLRPPARQLFEVRWMRADDSQVRMKRFTRRHDAEAWADQLRSYGKDVAVYYTVTSWLEVVS